MSEAQDSGLAMIEHDARRIRVLFGGHGIADSTDVLVVREVGKAPVRYFPQRDVEMYVLQRTGRQIHSESKGMATYFTIYRDAHVVENAVWSYESPPPAFQAIAGRIAFQLVHFEFQAEGHTTVDWSLAGEDGVPPLEAG